MFELLFKYPLSQFRQGSFLFLNTWSPWIMYLGIALAAAGFAYLMWFRKGASPMSMGRSIAIWMLQVALVAIAFFMAWRPALGISQLKPQQNIVAVILDDSTSMSTTDADGGATRKDAAAKVLTDGLLEKLKQQFQVRVYRMTDHLDRIEQLDQLTASTQATHIGESLKQVLADANSLPIGALVLLSDGADNSGGVDLETLTEIRRQGIPVHTIGLGKETLDNDIEVTNVDIPQRSLPDSRLSATVTFHSYGHSGDKAQLTVRDRDKVLAKEEVTLKGDGQDQVESVLFNAGPAGVKTIQATLDPLPAESNLKNNAMTRLVNVDQRSPRILYLEGEPRWEYKFLRRAVEDDKTITVVSILRTAPNKLYSQNTDPNNPTELENGYPTTVEQLFGFEGLIFGSVDAAYLNAAQLAMVKEFVDRRGGGILFLGGKDALGDGGWQATPVNEILPTILPDRPNTFQWAPSNVELTAEGRDSLITRIEDDPEANAKRWKDLPYVRNIQTIGQPKLGAIDLVDAIPMSGGGGRTPLLVTMNYGRGRTAIFATSGSWRWQMLQDVKDKSHEMFYQQLLRWLVNGTPKKVSASTPKSLLADETKVKIRADVRDKTYLPANDANVEARILSAGTTETIEMRPEIGADQGVFSADWEAPTQGDYLVEVVAKRGEEELGRDSFTFRREDGVAENFHVEQNRPLLEKLSSETGGHYYTPANAQDLAEDILISPAGITVRETRDLWDMPLFFMLLLGGRAVEWLLRRKWGTI